MAGSASRGSGAYRLVFDSYASPPHADADSGRFHLRGHECRWSRTGCESGVGLGQGVPRDRSRECDRRSGRRNGGDHCGASVSAQQVVQSRNASDRGGCCLCGRGRVVHGRRDAGIRSGTARRRNSGLCRSRHAGPGSRDKLQAASPVRVRHYSADLLCDLVLRTL